MLRSPHRKQPSAWFTLGTLNIKSPNKFPSNHRIKFPQITDFFLKHLRISIIFTTFAADFKNRLLCHQNLSTENVLQTSY